jgi:hypothetical protein
VKTDRAEPLQRLVAEVRREPLPEIDWDAMEESLVSRLGEAPRFAAVRPLRSRSPFVLVLAAAALAGIAAAAVGVVNHAAPGAPQSVAVGAPASEHAARPRAVMNGNALAVGTVVQSEADPVVVDHEDHATWTLEPGSAAHVEELGGVVRIALDRGALTARVVKSLLPESFVVRVEGTRVAVHGTAFRVVRLEHSVRVEVTEGVVGVGPLGGPSFDVAAPSSATTTFAGVRTHPRHVVRGVTMKSAEHAHPGAAEATATENPEIAQAEEAQADETAAETPAPEETPEMAPSGATAQGAPQVAGRAPRASSSPQSIDGVVEAVRRCFREQTVTGGDLHISVSTQMSLRIQPSGRVGEAVFTPPLAPGVRRCVDESVGSINFRSSADGFAVDRVLELER